MARLAFCGLGQMGSAMAARLLEAGHDLTVWNRSPGRADELVRSGAVLAASPAEAADGAEGVMTMLADPTALNAVVFGTAGLPGLAEGLKPGGTLIEMSTVGPDALRGVAGRLGSTLQVMDAPVLGSLAQVKAGTLKIFVGGPVELMERWRPELEVLGTPYHLGPLGSGAAMKLVANSTLGALMTAFGEALAIGAALGLDQAKVLEMLAGSPIGVTASGKRANVESGSYRPNFKLALAVKDLDLVVETATRAGVELRVAEAARSWFKEALADGLGAMDYSAVVAEITGGPARLPDSPV